jgi:hypothetical protein
MSVTAPILPLLNQLAGEPEGADPSARGVSIPGNGSARESETSPAQIVLSNSVQDEVKVQMEPPGEIAVYQFVDQQGSLVLQVPPQQIVNLAQAIAQELEKEAAPQAPLAREPGGQHGH